MNGSSKNNDAFANIGESNRSFLEAHPNATTAQQLALFEGVVEGIKTALNSTHATESKKKEDAHATVLEKMNKEINDCKAKAVADAATINDWKEKAEVGATELKKKDAAHATELVKLNKEINEWKKKAEVGATELKKKEDAHADALKDLTGQVNAKEEKVRRLKKGSKAEKAKCDTLENFAKEQEIQDKKDEEELKRIIEKQKEEKAAKKLAFERDLRKRRESAGSTVSESSSA